MNPRIYLVATLLLASGGAARAAERAEAERGIALFEAGRYAEALGPLARAHEASPSDLDVTLLLGICDYRLDRIDDAEPLLRAAASAPDPQTGADAKLFLGLIARARGSVDDARAMFAGVAATGSDALAVSAAMLREHSAPKALSAFFMLRSEFDSNVALISTVQPATGTAQADAAALALGSLSFRPLASFGLVLRDTASYRRHLHLSGYDSLANSLSARWEYLGLRDRVTLGYTFDLATLGGPLLELGHAADAGYRRALAGQFGLAARVEVRHRDYQLSAYSGYSGETYTGTLEASFGTSERPFQLDLGAVVDREVTSDGSLIATARGGRLYSRGYAGIWFYSFTGLVLYRDFDQPMSDGTARQDLQLQGDLVAGIGIGANVALTAGGGVLRNMSTNGAFDYVKWTGHLGFDLAFEGP